MSERHVPEIGETICDMHDGFNINHLAHAGVKSAIAIPGGGVQFIQDTVRKQIGDDWTYTNKMLVCVGESSLGNWLLACSYDGASTAFWEIIPADKHSR